MASGKRDFPLRDLDSRAEEEDGNVAADTDDAVHCQDGTTETRQPLGGGESVEGVVSHQQSSPIHFREDTNHRGMWRANCAFHTTINCSHFLA